MDVKSAFLKAILTSLSMLREPPVLKTLGTPSMSTGCPMLSMVSSKFLELGMRGLGTSSTGEDMWEQSIVDQVHK